ncbi:MAG: DUF177 domain-containing protein [Proteobacteria bacterium]|nr:DUF177 domain-containing protein [Pseudomonadota bacterium]MDA1042272.1 DUF177 domain-containing protein [Pseudomonadota bacterium]
MQNPIKYACSNPFNVAKLSPRKPTRFDITAPQEDLQKMAHFLDIHAVKAYKFKGEITPKGKHDFSLTGQLIATVEQACIISLEPVYTKITEEVVVTYLAKMPIPEADEVEIPEDDTLEPLPETIDPTDVGMEALSLALPPFPRAPEARMNQAAFAAPGVEPLVDADVHPFAGLAGLVESLTKPPKTGD